MSRLCMKWMLKPQISRNDSFDIAVAMFVASVVPHPRLLAELKRVVCRATCAFCQSLLARRVVCACSVSMPWHALLTPSDGHPDFALEALLTESDIRKAKITPVPPFGLFSL